MKQVIDNKMFVTKRNGEVVDFDPEKIKIAIGKCIRAAKKEINQEGLNQIVNSIVEEIQTRFIDFYPNVENVQDIVEIMDAILNGGFTDECVDSSADYNLDGTVDVIDIVAIVELILGK